MNEKSNEQLWRCTVCGQVGTVGRCCGRDTREPVGESEPKHTPGPWHVLMRGNYMRLFMPKNRAGLTGDVARGYVGLANANLIAAAPELLDLAKRFRAELSEVVGLCAGDGELACLLADVDAAIAKATGKEADRC